MGLVCGGEGEAEVSLDIKERSYSYKCKCKWVPETINGFVKQVGSMSDASEVDDFVRRLENEMNKIHVFKRELPLSMLLLKHAIMYLKQETTLTTQYQTRNAHQPQPQPVLEEFIPLKTDDSISIGTGTGSQITTHNSNSHTGAGAGAGAEKQKVVNDDDDCGTDKKNWMSSVQLWSADDSLTTSYYNNHITTSTTTSTTNSNSTSNSNSNAPITNLISSNHTHNFITTTTTSNPSHTLKGNDKRNHIGGNDPGIIRSRRTESVSKGYAPYPTKFPDNVHKQDVNNAAALSLLVPGMVNQDTLPISRISNCPSSPASGVRPSSSSSSARKQRRCWSPELHRRFVDALTHLGGPQVATPKQIRELMRVDGLTNDEVKSHLQKYRLHSRRVPNNSGSCSNKNGQDGLRGSWTAQPQDQYSESSKPSSSQSASPEGPHQFPTGGDHDSMGDEDDEKSESYSWNLFVHTPGKDADDV